MTQMRGVAATALRLATEAGEAVGTLEDPQYMGHYYIHNGYPIRGSEVDAQGRMHMLLQCFRVPDNTTAGQFQAMKFDPKDAEYFHYHGLMARGQGDPGLMLGYTEFCYGIPGQADEMRGMTMTKTELTRFPHPKLSYDTTGRRFDNYHGMIADTDEIIALYARADAIRSPKYQHMRRSIV